MLELKDLRAGYGRREVIKAVSLRFNAGSFYGIIGPNSAGKSTLVKLMGRFLHPSSGTVIFEGKNLWKMKAIEAARNIAVIPQDNHMPFNFTVEEVIAMGRAPYMPGTGYLSKVDRASIAGAAEMLGITHLLASQFNFLSGGEKQKVVTAKAVAQAPKYLIMDEPVSALDIKNQISTLNFIKDYSKKNNICVIGVFHDINTAALYVDEFAAVRDGRVVAAGKPGDIITAANIELIYGIKAGVTRNQFTGTPVISINPMDIRSER